MALSLLCVGEVLWDVFPDGEYLGGAPLNVAVLSSILGLESGVLSAVGDDGRGRKALERIEEYGVQSFVSVDGDHPTGVAEVSLSEDKVPSFSLPRGAAYDYLSSPGPSSEVVGGLPFVYVGSLVQRGPVSREVVRSLLRAADGRVVFDVNKRPGMGEWGAVVRDTLPFTSVLKVNEEELEGIAEEFGTDDVIPFLFREFPLELVCVTKGSDGVEAFTAESSFSVPTPEVEVVDTTGCGDAFCAALVSGLHQGLGLREVVERGVVVAGVVAGFRGAIPPAGDLRAALKARSILI